MCLVCLCVCVLEAFVCALSHNPILYHRMCVCFVFYMHIHMYMVLYILADCTKFIGGNKRNVYISNINVYMNKCCQQPTQCTVYYYYSYIRVYKWLCRCVKSEDKPLSSSSYTVNSIQPLLSATYSLGLNNKIKAHTQQNKKKDHTRVRHAQIKI